MNELLLDTDKPDGLDDYLAGLHTDLPQQPAAAEPSVQEPEIIVQARHELIAAQNEEAALTTEQHTLPGLLKSAIEALDAPEVTRLRARDNELQDAVLLAVNRRLAAQENLYALSEAIHNTAKPALYDTLTRAENQEKQAIAARTTAQNNFQDALTASRDFAALKRRVQAERLALQRRAQLQLGGNKK